MFNKIIVVIALASISAILVESAKVPVTHVDVHEKLVVPGVKCEETYDCKETGNAHCNTERMCQCDFGHLPTDGKCVPFKCFLHTDCEYHFGPNEKCNMKTDNCICAPGWELNVIAQQCLNKA